MASLRKKDFQKAVRERIPDLTDEDVFASEAIREIMEAVLATVCRGHGRIPRIETRYMPEDSLTAKTNGNTVTINTMGPLIRELPDRWRKYVCCFGHVTHECGHILHTDFRTLNALRQGWHATEFTFGAFRPADEEEARKIERFLNDGKHNAFRRIYADALSGMLNVLEDVFVENCLYEEFDGLCAAGLHLANAEKYRISSTEKELYGMAARGKILPVHAAINVLQIRRLGYPVKPGEPLDEKEAQIKAQVEDVLAECAGFIDELAWEYDGKKRAVLYNEAALCFFRLIPGHGDAEAQGDPGAGSGQNGGNEGGADQREGEESRERQEGEAEPAGAGPEDPYTEARARRLVKNARALGEANGMSTEAEGFTEPVEMCPDRGASESGKATASENAASEEALKRWEQLADREAAGELVAREEEKKQALRLQKEADAIRRSTMDDTGGCAFERYTVRRPSMDGNRQARKELYNAIYAQAGPSARGLTRRLEQILAERKEEGYDSGYLTGQRFNPGDVWRNDARYFSRAVLPDGVPDVAFALMVDESGSMSGARNARARECAVLLEDALRNLGVPLLVCGHDASYGGEVRLNVYADFDTMDEYDRYRLTDISAGHYNCDGGVITYLSEKLLKRDEAAKVLIVISDGTPTVASFYDRKDRAEDTRAAIEKYRKKGVRIFGAVIDEYEKVEKIYGKEFSFDCHEDRELERNVMRIVKRYVLKK